MWTKRDFVMQAFDAIGLGSEYDLDPEQLQSALRKLDAMMGMWDAKGIKVGYPLAQTPGNSDLDQDTSVSEECSEAIYTNLAQRIAPAFGKMISPGLQIIAKQAYDSLLIKAAQPGQMQYPGNMPLGAGNRGSGYQRYSTMPTDQLTTTTQVIDL